VGDKDHTSNTNKEYKMKVCAAPPQFDISNKLDIPQEYDEADININNKDSIQRRSILN